MDFKHKYGEEIISALKSELSVSEIASILAERKDNYDTNKKRYYITPLQMLKNIHKFLSHNYIDDISYSNNIPKVLRDYHTGNNHIPKILKDKINGEFIQDE